MAQAHEQIVVPLESFRKDRIGGVKEHKKKFDKKTAKFCQAQERFLNISSKKPDNTIQEVSSLTHRIKKCKSIKLKYVLQISVMKNE